MVQSYVMVRSGRERRAPDPARAAHGLRAVAIAMWASWAACLPGCGPAGGADAAADVTAMDRPATLDATPDAAVDTPETDAGCEEFAGAYAISSICLPLSASLFGAMCVTQVGCEVTVVASGTLFRGHAIGNRADLRAATAPGVACTLAQTSSGLSIGCVDDTAATTCSGSASEFTVPTATRFCCDLLAQDCGAGSRCTLVLAGDRGALMPACLPLTGHAAVGVTCTRSMAMVGFDPCAAGLFCANTGQPARDVRACRALCNSSAQCGAGSVCYNLSSVQTAGVCTPACVIGGADCGAGTTCRHAPTLHASGNPTYAGICDPLGTTALGAPCGDSADCMAGETCGFSHTGPTCQTLCDLHTPCAPDQSCVSTAPAGTPNPPGQGSCQ
ncbi:MAG: hypothetical protein WCJ30_02750 [Deltaproteobacteria bacterium]